jgi:hypothetical protein
MMDPVRYQIVKEQPNQDARKMLIYISKILQNIANGITDPKENFLVPFKEYLTESVPKIKEFYQNMMEEPENKIFLKIDLSKTIKQTLATLHKLVYFYDEEIYDVFNDVYVDGGKIFLENEETGVFEERSLSISNHIKKQLQEIGKPKEYLQKVYKMERFFKLYKGKNKHKKPHVKLMKEKNDLFKRKLFKRQTKCYLKIVEIQKNYIKKVDTLKITSKEITVVVKNTQQNLDDMNKILSNMNYLNLKN